MTRFTDWLDGLSYAVEGSLTCQECHIVSQAGIYFPEKKMVVFTCTNGHRNEVPYE